MTVTRAQNWVTELIELRYQDYTIPMDLPGRIQLLIQLRGRLDRIERLLTQIVAERTGAKLEENRAKAVREERWDEQSVIGRRQPGQQYLGARERYADANLDVLELTRALRRAEETSITLEAFVDIARTAYRGLDNARMDLIQILKTSGDWTSNLERGA